MHCARSVVVVASMVAAIGACSLTTSLDGLANGNGSGVGDASPNADGAFDAQARGDGTANNGGTSTYRDLVLSDRPLAYYRLDDASGTAKDEVGAHDGVYKGAVAHAPGAIAGDANGAARFDGATSYVEVGDVLPFLGNAPFTVEAWTSLDADADAKNPTCIASKSFAQTGATGGVTEGYTFYLATGSHELTMARYRSSTDDAVRGPVVTTGVFTHVVATYDGATTALWLNGQPVASAPSTKVLVSHTKPLVLGAGRGGIFCFFKGALDEIAFYAAALPGDRIRAHYQAGIK